MKKNLASKGHQHLEHIWQQVPPDYYQKGIKKNILQRLWHKGKLKVVLQEIEKNRPSPTTILDMGCASGWFLSQVSKKFRKATCYGVDVYKQAILYGKKKYKNIHFKKEDIHKVSYKANTFDIVICSEVLEHVLDPEKVLKEIKRVMKRKGIGIIEMDSGNFLFQVVWYWWTNMRHGVWEDAHLHVFNSKRLELLIKKAGLKIQTKKLFNYSMAVVFTVTK